MSINYSAATKNARMDAVVSAIGTSGKLKLYTSADALVATFALAATAGTVSGGVLTFSDANGGADGILSTTASATGTVAKATFTTSADAVVISGLTVATSAADLIVDNPAVVSGQTVVISSASITHA